MTRSLKVLTTFAWSLLMIIATSPARAEVTGPTEGMVSASHRSASGTRALRLTRSTREARSSASS